jgi:hypothetical protein
MQDGGEYTKICIDSHHYVVVGFTPDELTAEERGEGYPVQAGFLSGRPVRGGGVSLIVTFGTAGKVFPSTPYTLIITYIFLCRCE